MSSTDYTVAPRLFSEEWSRQLTGSSRLRDCHVVWFSSVSVDKSRYSNLHCLSRWPRCLSCRSTAAWLLGSRVRIPLRVWMFVVFVLWIATSATSCSLVRTSPTGCVCVSNCVWFRNFNLGPSWAVASQKIKQCPRNCPQLLLERFNPLLNFFVIFLYFFIH